MPEGETWPLRICLAYSPTANLPTTKIRGASGSRSQTVPPTRGATDGRLLAVAPLPPFSCIPGRAQPIHVRQTNRSRMFCHSPDAITIMMIGRWRQRRAAAARGRVSGASPLSDIMGHVNKNDPGEAGHNLQHSRKGKIPARLFSAYCAPEQLQSNLAMFFAHLDCQTPIPSSGRRRWHHCSRRPGSCRTAPIRLRGAEENGL